jgi:signal peptidase II
VHAPAATRGARTALRDLGSHLRLWTVAVIGVGLDLWSKEWAFRTLRQGGHRELIPGVLEFHTTLNPGALFGIGAGHTEVFLVASVLALVLVVWMFAQSPAQRWLTHVALGAILAGALGNMYDRAFVNLVEFRQPGQLTRYYVERFEPEGNVLTLHEYPSDMAAAGPPIQVPVRMRDRLGEPTGYVRDFIKIPTRWLGGRELWPWVFNVADMLLVGGVGVLAFKLLRERRSEPEPQRAALDVPVGEP